MPRNAERFVGNCVVVGSRVLNGDHAADTLKAGSTYGHELTTMNEAVWTLDVYVHSVSNDPKQVAYARTRQPKEWILAVTLSPAEEQVSIEILSCLERRSGRNRIETKVLLSNNLSDKLAIELTVE